MRKPVLYYERMLEVEHKNILNRDENESKPTYAQHIKKILSDIM